MTINNISHFLNRIQKSDDETKRRWLIIFSSVAIVLVIILWASYLKWTIVAIAPASGSAQKQVTHWDVFQVGLGVVGSKVEFGLVNSYLYFHEKLLAGNIFTYEK